MDEDGFNVEEYLRREVTAMSQDNEIDRLLDLATKASIPMEVLDLPPIVWLNFDFDEKEIKMQFRKKSLLVHPDKCRNPKAKDAFEVLKQAEKTLMDSEQRSIFVEAMRHARIMVDEDLRGKRELKHITEDTESYLKLLKFGVRKNFGEVKARIGLRRKNEEEIEQKELVEAEAEKKRKFEHDQTWKKSREVRVDSWRKFQAKGGPKKRKTHD